MNFSKVAELSTAGLNLESPIQIKDSLGIKDLNPVVGSSATYLIF